MVLAVDAAHPDVHHGVAGQGPASAGFVDPLLHGRDQVARDGAAHDFVHELDALPTGLRLDREVADAEHALASGLLLELALDVLRLARDRLPVGNLRGLQLDLHTEHPLQLLHRGPDVELSHAGKQELSGGGLPPEMERRILLHQSAE